MSHVADIKKQRERLIELLKELFQLNQPDLDFGLYRIMHAKADQVSKFLDQDLLSIIGEAFGKNSESLAAKAKAAYEAAIQQAKDFGAPDPEVTQPVQEAKAVFIAAKDADSDEADVYDHLYRFFERYYDNGDFMSLRYFTRETDGRAAPYAVPYDGREVYLHWANRDQYYIKTSEYLTNFTFDLALAKESNEKHKELFESKSLKVHFRVVSAGEGEHNNVKAAEQNKRYFIIHRDEPLKLETDEEGKTSLVIQFEYRADPEKSGQERAWRKKRLEEAAAAIKEAFSELSSGDNFAKALLEPAPTENEKSRTLLEKYLLQYTARNTMDYFIHKDLGGFLRRELDFYIKNEILHLDDIKEHHLAKIKVLRAIARHLIDFLAQIEEFQKKLWLKKKFVVEANYCVTLDRVPESFYGEIRENEQQIQEWKKLFAINELEGYSASLKKEFLEENPYLILDTALFSEDFKCRLLSALEDIDEQTDGLIIHSENFQALNLLREKYEERIKCVYIDPPYNTDAAPIIYKNNYKHSNWLSLMFDRIAMAHSVQPKATYLQAISIDENEADRLSLILEEFFPNENKTPVSVVHNPRGRRGEALSVSHESLYFVFPRGMSLPKKKLVDKKEKPLMKTGSESERHTSRNCFYPILINQKGELLEIGDVSDEDFHPNSPQVEKENGIIELYPLCSENKERKWRYKPDSLREKIEDVSIRKTRNNNWVVYLGKTEEAYKTVWSDASYNAAEHGSVLLKKMMPDNNFDFPKSIYTIQDVITLGLEKPEGIVLDYFAGSGTTGHAVINLNREDEGKRKYILVEMGDHFDTVLKPRIQKVIYSKDWNDGKPVSREGSSHCFKYIRLESYEDALNNLTLKSSPDLASADSKFVRDYMLRYWLDVETKGSPSLLNIKDFDDPVAYTLKVKKPGTDEYVEKAVDLVETFNLLIGLHVQHLDQWRGYDASFKREKDPELPENGHERLLLDGNLKEVDDGAWQLRKIEGCRFRTPGYHSHRERILVIWRKLTGDIEQDNLVLDEWFKKHCLSTRKPAFDIVYVNGTNNLRNLCQVGEAWKVHLIEEVFHQAMWDVES